jgi:hypothetical protein
MRTPLFRDPANKELWLWRVEVGFRAALHTETRPRDLRWFRLQFDRRPWH